MICVCFLLPSRGGAMIASRDSFPSEPRRACDRGVNHRFDFIERDDLICRMLGAQCPAGRFLNLRWFGRRITSGRVGRRNHWHPRRGEGSVWAERGAQAAAGAPSPRSDLPGKCQFDNTVHRRRGTENSNPAPSTGESGANLTSSPWPSAALARGTEPQRITRGRGKVLQRPRPILGRL
jgi:hypothetical protein